MKLVITLFLFFSIGILFILKFNLNDIILSISTGFIVATFFWFITIYIPQRNKHKIIINKFTIFFNNFKEHVIQILLNACGEYTSNFDIKHLLDPTKFTEFFGENKKARFYEALNNIQCEKRYIDKLIIEFKLLLNESIYVINNINILNEDLYNFVSSLNENLYRLEHDDNLKNDQVKYLGTMLWSYLANYSYIKGYYKQDRFKKMISGLY